MKFKKLLFVAGVFLFIVMGTVDAATLSNTDGPQPVDRTLAGTWPAAYGADEDYIYPVSSGTCDITWTIAVSSADMTRFKLSSSGASGSPQTANKGETKTITSVGVTSSTTANVECTRSDSDGGCAAGYTLTASRSCSSPPPSCTDDCSSDTCTSGTFKPCGNYDADSCKDWGTSVNCNSASLSASDKSKCCSAACGKYGASSETCSDSIDNDCNGLVDDGCSSPPPTGCTPTATQVCGSNVGECQTGTKTCDSTGNWGTCVGEITAVTEVCGDSKDNDCDGAIDDGCSCTIGETRQCGSDVGECAFGEQVCGSGATWGECIGEVKSAKELCNDNKDNDCDGKVDKTDADCYGDNDEIPEDNPNDNDGVNPIDHSSSSSKTWTFVKNNPVVVGVTVGAAVLIIGLGAFYFLRKKQ